MRLTIYLLAVAFVVSNVARGNPPAQECPDVLAAPSCPPGAKAHCPETVCATNEKIAHLVEAAKHLRAAGMNCEADRVRDAVQTLRAELLAEKVAQMERLHGEITELRHVMGRQVILRTSVVEVSTSGLRKLGFDFQQLEAKCPSSGGESHSNDQQGLEREDFVMQVCDGAGVYGLLDALLRERLVKVLAEPTLVTLDGRPATYKTGGEVQMPVVGPGGLVRMQAREVGTRIDIEPQLLDKNRIRLRVHPRVATVDPSMDCQVAEHKCPGLRVMEVDTGCDMELGKTLVIAGPRERRNVNCCAESTEDGAPEICEVQTFFLFTPELVLAGPPSDHTARPPVPEPSPVR